MADRAKFWSDDKRERFANDRRNLLAVGDLNPEERRGRRHLAAAAQGLPLHICRDAGAHQGPLRTVAHRPEKAAITRILQNC